MNATAATVAADDERPGQAWARASWVAVGLAAACALAELVAGPGYRFGWWGLGAGIQTIRWAATAAAAVFALAILGAAMAYRGRARRTVAILLAAATLGFLAAAPPALFWFRLNNLPRIHDVSTDTENPPQYVAILPLRQGAINSTDYDAAVAARQRLGYPDIAPAMLALPAPQALALAERVARSMGWEMVSVDRTALRVEATATSLLFGFKDDIVIRVTPSGSGSRVDLRSLSRVGGSDFGANARRIRAFIKTLQAEAAP